MHRLYRYLKRNYQYLRRLKYDLFVRLVRFVLSVQGVLSGQCQSSSAD